MITLTATITIDDGEIISIDRRNMISIESSIFDRSDLKLPNWGIISNTGRIEFNDTDGQILALAEDLRLTGGLRALILLKNTLVEGSEQTVAEMKTNEWDYDNDNKLVSVSIKDDLEEWQEIMIDEVNYDPRQPQPKNFRWLYEHLYSVTPSKYNMVKFDDLDEETKAVLENTYTRFPFISASSLWVGWTKLCEACLLHIYKTKNGRTTCRYNGGN